MFKEKVRTSNQLLKWVLVFWEDFFFEGVGMGEVVTKVKIFCYNIFICLCFKLHECIQNVSFKKDNVCRENIHGTWYKNHGSCYNSY